MYEKTKNEKYAEEWFAEHGFQFTLVKQYISKTEYTVSKDGIIDNFELPSTVMDINQYMKQFEKSFSMKVEIEKLKNKLKIQAVK
jgi:hypothetical protein